MTLSLTETQQLEELYRDLSNAQRQDELLLRYYDAEQTVRHLGMAIPPNMRSFTTVTDGPRVVVDSVVERQQVRFLVLPGEEREDARLRAIWDGSNMQAHLEMFNRDRRVYGRAFFSVGANEDDPELPLIRVESPREMVARVDVRKEKIEVAARFYGSTAEDGPTHATLYLPDQTVWVARSDATRRWAEVDRDAHRLGVVPIVVHLNRRMSSGWTGRSALTPAILSITDASARTLTNLQFAIEAHGIPRVWMTGVAKGDFVDATGKPIPQWAAYYNAIHTLTDDRARIGQLNGADVKNFDTALDIYSKQMATATGFPANYFGVSSVNPPAEGAIRGLEARLIRATEAENEQVGMTVGWAAALARRFATGEWVTGNRIRVDWFDPATPTIAQRADAVVKAKQSGILSREGAWDELGWSEARKAKERAYFEAEAVDPAIERLLRPVSGDAAPLG